MTTYHAFPVGDPARSTPAGMRWLDHKIAESTERAHRDRWWWVVVSYDRQLKIEALEYLRSLDGDADHFRNDRYALAHRRMRMDP